MRTTSNYHLGLLNLIYLLVKVDGVVDQLEQEAIQQIKSEEDIPAALLHAFQKSVESCNEQDLYRNGIEFLNQCNEEEKLCAFVHLYRLAQADHAVHEKEIRLLLYGMKKTDIEFEDIVMGANMARNYNKMAS
jgi:uncharacterized tellurite resistance protein B-like protein